MFAVIELARLHSLPALARWVSIIHSSTAHTLPQCGHSNGQRRVRCEKNDIVYTVYCVVKRPWAF
jgi:hypothetical protein